MKIPPIKIGALVIGVLTLAHFVSCGGGATGPRYEVSTELLTVKFKEGVSDSIVRSIGSDNGLIVLFRYNFPWANAYRLRVDRTVTPANITATMIAEKLLSAYPASIDTAYAMVATLNALE